MSADFEKAPVNGILSHAEMCARERRNLQHGMNFRCSPSHSVILMSVRPGAPYRDRIDDNGALIYEGHDVPRTADLTTHPKLVDQPHYTPTGGLTPNGKFFRAARAYREGNAASPELVRVYEKIKSGIWSYNGPFHLVDAWLEHDGQRNVFRFRLVPSVEGTSQSPQQPATFAPPSNGRLIPTAVKQAVWKRDSGRCVTCGSTDQLHFDHIIPYSLGGTSLSAENIQLLCARHNLTKSAHIV